MTTKIDQHVDTIPARLVFVAALAACVWTVVLDVAPDRTDFYAAVTTVSSAALIAVAIDNRNIAPSTVSTPRRQAGLLLGISVGLLASILGSLIAIGLDHSSPLLFGITAGPGAYAIFMLLVAVTLRAANYGVDEDRKDASDSSD